MTTRDDSWRSPGLSCVPVCKLITPPGLKSAFKPPETFFPQGQYLPLREEGWMDNPLHGIKSGAFPTAVV